MGAPMDVVTEVQAVEAIVTAAESGSGHWAITANLDHLRRYRSSPAEKQLIEEADLVVADGMPVVWASRLAGTPLPERVSGSSMVWSLCQAASQRGQTVYLVGGDPGVAGRAANVLRNMYPGLTISSTSSPRAGFEGDELELAHTLEHMTESRPQIVLVALGFPKQDLLIQELRESLPTASFLGVGISLSYVTGDLSRPPAWICNVGLEWAYRLMQEPTQRLLRRYVVDGIPFALRLMASATTHRASGGRFAGSSGWGRRGDNLGRSRIANSAD